MKKSQLLTCKDSKKIFIELEISNETGDCSNPVPISTNTNMDVAEKHLPVLEYEPGKLKVVVGNIQHPMQQEHYINWILVQTESEILCKYLNPGDLPEAVFYGVEDIIGVYAYCNLHGLWEVEEKEFRFSETVCSAEFTDACIDQ